MILKTSLISQLWAENCLIAPYNQFFALLLDFEECLHVSDADLVRHLFTLLPEFGAACEL